MILITPQIVKNADDLKNVSTVQRVEFSDAIKKKEMLDVPATLERKSLQASPTQGAATR